MLVPGGEAGDELPGAVLRADGVPLDLRGTHPAGGEAVEHEVAELGGVVGAPHREPAGLLDHPGTLREHGALVPLHVLHRQAGGLGHLLSGGAGTDPRLDVLGPQPTVRADLLELRPVTADGGTQRVVDQQRVALAVRSGERESLTVAVQPDEFEL